MTPAGWSLLALAVLGWALGVPLHWSEMRLLGASASLVVVVGLLAVWLPRPATATLAAHPARTAVGSTTTVRLEVRAAAVPVPSPVVRLEGEIASQVLRLRTLWPRRTRSETIEHVATRRGIFELGPVRHVQSDPLGLFRRTHAWGRRSTLWVRPRVVVPDEFHLGGVFDLEGLPSEQISASDLAFHSLREYVPGDDLRNVHWRSSAKAATLLVRQYVESRTMHAAVVVDDDPEAYDAPEDFELAISVGASLAIRALDDGFDVDLACGDRASAPIGREALLDDTCAWTLTDRGTAPVDVAARSTQLTRATSAIGVGVVVSGPSRDLERLLEATAAFGGDARRIAVRVARTAESSVRVSHGVHVLEVAGLEDLPRLVAWASA